MEKFEKLLTIQDLCKYYPMGKAKKDGDKKEIILKAVDGVTFNIFKGENLGVVGESGCGKSTLGRCLLKLIDATDGKIIFNGEDITDLNSKGMIQYRKDMQMVFQNPYSSFNPKKTIGKNLSEVAEFYGLKSKEAKERIQELLQYVNMDTQVLGRRCDELSGGQLQRLAVVRALIPNPKFIVADEPVSALDVSVQAQILNLLYDLKDQFHLTMMFISHELTVVEHICDRVMVMYLGGMVEIGVTEEIFGNTMHPYTKALIASKPKDFPEEEKEQVILEGEVPSPTNVPTGCRFHTRCAECIKGKCDVEIPPLYKVADRHWVVCHKAKEAAKAYEEARK
ncbi:MAG: ATP-binding cassette domain-containing protein [Lachnospiraceae bacterium]|nr:ATP-binding cassette domain-containing protein [Lachnospiraceae bacterium]